MIAVIVKAAKAASEASEASATHVTSCDTGVNSFSGCLQGSQPLSPTPAVG